MGGPSTCLLREIEAHWNLSSAGELIALGNLRAPSETATPPDFASLAPVVARCAADGDALAAGILQRAGEELAVQELAVQPYHRGPLQSSEG